MAFATVLVTLLTASSFARAQLSVLPAVPNTYPNLTACVDTPLTYSCENTTTITNTCCSPTPGGLVLQTQFWNTYTGLESKGQLLPKGSWTIHGLWPDNCDGSYQQYCDFSRQYDSDPSPGVPAYTGPGVDTFIEKFHRFDLLDYMNKYWINQGAPNPVFWAHEFSKHATCTSTFDVACYGPDYVEHQDVINFFDSVIRTFSMYPTYNLLAVAGIVPSNQTTYSQSRIQNALKAQTGAVPYLGCGGNGTILEEVWYYHHVLGSEQYGHYETLDSTPYGASTCSTTKGIWYYERTRSSEREVQ